jgi:flagellar hook protein FlgE
MAVGSFSAALSGLNSNAIYLSVIGNNLANINTVGFKSSSVTFQDLVSQTLKLGGGGGNPVQIGLGVITPGRGTSAMTPTVGWSHRMETR